MLLTQKGNKFMNDYLIKQFVEKYTYEIFLIENDNNKTQDDIRIIKIYNNIINAVSTKQRETVLTMYGWIDLTVINKREGHDDYIIPIADVISAFDIRFDDHQKFINFIIKNRLGKTTNGITFMNISGINSCLLHNENTFIETNSRRLFREMMVSCEVFYREIRDLCSQYSSEKERRMIQGYQFIKKRMKKEIAQSYIHLIDNRNRKIEYLEATIKEYESEKKKQLKITQVVQTEMQNNLQQISLSLEMINNISNISNFGNKDLCSLRTEFKKYIPKRKTKNNTFLTDIIENSFNLLENVSNNTEIISKITTNLSVTKNSIDKSSKLIKDFPNKFKIVDKLLLQKKIGEKLLPNIEEPNIIYTGKSKDKILTTEFIGIMRYLGYTQNDYNTIIRYILPNLNTTITPQYLVGVFLVQEQNIKPAEKLTQKIIYVQELVQESVPKKEEIIIDDNELVELNCDEFM